MKDIRFLRIGKKEYDVFEEVEIDEDNLDLAFKDHPGKVMFWTHLRAKQKAFLEKKEDEYEETRRMRFKQYWELYEEERGRNSFSDSLIWAEVGIDEKVAELRKEVRLARKRFDAVKAVCEALEHRKSSLINLGALRRNEEDLSIRRR